MKICSRKFQSSFLGQLLLSLLIFQTVTAQTSSYTPGDSILLDCGSDGTTYGADKRQWTGDMSSKIAPYSQNALTSKPQSMAPGVPNVAPFTTVRIISSEFTYAVPVGPGRKFVRLYFYPNQYGSRAVSDGVFDVTSGSFTLLHNFSASLTSQALNFDYLIQEFSINATGGTLNLTFTPAKGVPNAYAFINGIEVVSMPYMFEVGTNPVFVMPKQPYSIVQSTALQNVYRLNVGGKYVSPTEDSGLFRSWDNDSPYIYGAAFGVSYPKDSNVTMRYPKDFPGYIAPTDVYATARSMGPNANINQNYNLTWILSVDSNFTYLVRLHFCEIQFEITKPNQRVFQIFINNQTAEEEADVISWNGNVGNGIPIFKDYVVIIPEKQGEPFTDLWIALHPNTNSASEFYDAVLNGIEVFKLNNSDGNLAGANPNPLHQPDVQLDKIIMSAKKNRVPAIIGGAMGGIAVLCILLLLFTIFWRRNQGKDSSSSDGPSAWLPLPLYGNSHSGGSVKTGTTGSYASTLPANLCRHFSFAEIKAATNNFDEALVLGVGGFGKVYKGEIDGGITKVAIKRGNPLSEQGVHEFQTEIEMLSKLRHHHLVSLIGYCEENCEMILVYDYMAHGSLREHLYKTHKQLLPWQQRLEICIGAARGLHYLHTGAKHTIIHRDVKTTNILLDEKWVAKMSDFGLSKTGPTLDDTHVSTVVKGSFGYLDPEYIRRQQLTEKSDVYSFGVVLFEVLCARPAFNSSLPREQVILAEWVLHCQKKGTLDQIIDPYLEGKIAPECLKKFAETAEKCVADQGIDRPSMGDVLWNLEFALQLQESAEESGLFPTDTDNEETPFTRKQGEDAVYCDYISDSKSSATTMSLGSHSLVSDDSDGLTPSAVFSQIMNPKGR